MPRIPVNISAMPRELEGLDEGIPYHGIVRSCDLADLPDKNGNLYLTNIRVEILDPEQFRGRAAFVNYMKIMGDGDKVQTELDLLFPRFIDAFKVPFYDDGFDPIDAIGCEGDFTIEMDEYQGRKTVRVKNFLL